MVSVYIAQPRLSGEAFVLPQREVLNFVDSFLGGITISEEWMGVVRGKVERVGEEEATEIGKMRKNCFLQYKLI